MSQRDNRRIPGLDMHHLRRRPYGPLSGEAKTPLGPDQVNVIIIIIRLFAVEKLPFNEPVRVAIPNEITLAQLVSVCIIPSGFDRLDSNTVFSWAMEVVEDNDGGHSPPNPPRLQSSSIGQHSACG
jgi:hypothetical protein